MSSSTNRFLPLANDADDQMPDVSMSEAPAQDHDTTVSETPEQVHDTVMSDGISYSDYDNLSRDWNNLRSQRNTLMTHRLKANQTLKSKKRPADPAPHIATTVRSFVVELQRRIKKAKAAEEAAALNLASTSHAMQELDHFQETQELAQVPTDAMIGNNEFRYIEIPFRASWQPCVITFAQDDIYQYFGQLETPTKQWDVFVKIDAGRTGYPKISFRIRVDKQHKLEAVTGKTDCDVFECSWYAGTPASRTAGLQVEYFDAESFNNWQSRAFTEWHRPFLRGDWLENVRDVLWTFECQLRGLNIERDFEDQTRWTTHFQLLSDRLMNMETEAYVLRFWFKPEVSGVITHLKWFSYQMSNNLGVLSQYKNPTTGESTLQRVQEAPTIDAVGDGIYCKPDGKSFFQLDRRETFLTIEELGIYAALTAIREAQARQEHPAFSGRKALECFVLSNRDFGRKVEKAAPPMQSYKEPNSGMLVYIRCDSKEEKRLVPESKLKIELEWDTATHSLPHVSNDNNTVHGVTLACQESDLAATGTDLCVFVPFVAFQRQPPAVYRSLHFRKSLPRAYVRVSYNSDAHQRELDASNQFAISNYHPLVNFRSMLMNSNAAASAQQASVDLRQGVPKKGDNVQLFHRIVGSAGNVLECEGQMNFLNRLGNVNGNVLTLVGPPGTGKTLALAYAIRDLIAVGHRVLGVGPSGKSAIDLAREVRNTPMRNSDMKSLWLGSTSAEMRSLLRKELAKVHLEEASDDWHSLDVEIDEEAEVVYNGILAEETGTEQLLKFQQDFEQHQELYYAAQSSNVSIRNPELCFQDTMAGHIWRITTRDMQIAEVLSTKDQDTFTCETEIYSTIDKREISAEYDKLHHDWIQQRRNVDIGMKKHFLRLRAQMENRVFSELDCMFTTMNESGAQDFEKFGFKPTVIVIDEGGQASLSATCIPLTNFHSYEAIIVAGNWWHIRPKILAREKSEVFNTSMMSVLERLEKNGSDVVHLTQQFRMPESISRFLSKHAYDGRLVTPPSAQRDYINRQIVRKVGQSRYGLQVRSEYFFVNVPFGVLRREQNYANVDAVEKLLDHLLAEGMRPDDIMILCMHRSQAQLMALKITAMGGRFQSRNVSTVEAFQGSEAPLIIFDSGLASYDAIRDSAIHGRAGGNRVIFPSIIRDHVGSQICNAITRAMDGLIIIGQAELLSRKLQKDTKAHKNTLFRMIKDLWVRGLVGHEDDIADTDPFATAQEHVKDFKTRRQRKDIVRRNLTMQTYTGK
ncbi:MAG: hypothetical protein Q9212_006364 [Teloschistes hypoglaucus]